MPYQCKHALSPSNEGRQNNKRYKRLLVPGRNHLRNSYLALSARTETLTPVDASAAKRQAASLSSSEQRFAHLPRKLDIWTSFGTNIDIAATPSCDLFQGVSHTVRASVKLRCSNHRGSDRGIKLRRVCYKNVLPCCINNRRT